ncbi:hypothetical protein V6N13_092130 [Hibiscus sabdariffa]
MVSPIWFITLVLSYVSIGVGVAFVSTLAAGSVMSAKASYALIFAFEKKEAKSYKVSTHCVDPSAFGGFQCMPSS